MQNGQNKLSVEEKSDLSKREVVEHDDPTSLSTRAGWEARQRTTETPSEEAEGTHDDVEHPSHYTSHPSGVECIQIVEHMTFNAGNAVKYLWRSGIKNDDAITDLRKAEWYVRREIQRLEQEAVRS